MRFVILYSVFVIVLSKTSMLFIMILNKFPIIIIWR